MNSSCQCLGSNYTCPHISNMSTWGYWLGVQLGQRSRALDLWARRVKIQHCLCLPRLVIEDLRSFQQDSFCFVWRSPSPGRDVLRSSLKEEENWVGGAAAGLGSWEDRFYRERRHPLLRPTLWMRPVWPWAEGPDSWPSESEIINVPSFGFR